MSADTGFLCHVLKAVAEELDLPRRSILAVEHHVGATLNAKPAEGSFLRDLQELDLAVQVLDDLTTCLEMLSRIVPDNLLVDLQPALERVRLERVAASLRAKLGIAQPPEQPTPDLELF